MEVSTMEGHYATAVPAWKCTNWAASPRAGRIAFAPAASVRPSYPGENVSV